MFEGGTADNSGDMVCVFEELAMVGDCVDYSVSGDIDCTMQQAELVMEGVTESQPTNELSMAFETMDATMHAGASMECSFVEPHLEMTSGTTMNCTFELPQFEAYSSYRSKDMEVTFKEFEFFAIGDNKFNSMSLEFEAMELYMQTGAGLELEFEEPQFEAVGHAGLTAQMDCRMERPDIEMHGGPLPYIEAALEPFEFTGTGNSDIVSSLNLTMKYPVLEMSGDNGLVGSISASLEQMRGQFSMDLDHSVGSMNCVMKPMQLEMGSLEVIDGTIVAQIERIRMEMTAFYDGINNLDMVMKEPEILMSSGLGEDDGSAGGSSCDLADVLTFDEDY